MPCERCDAMRVQPRLLSLPHSHRPSPSSSAMPARVWSTARRTVIAVLCAALVVSHTHATPIEGRSPSLARRQGRVNYTDPNIDGGSMLTILPGNETIGLGEPINVILSGQSDASVLTVEGFLRWVTSINFGVSCLGQANGTAQLANLGDGRGNVTQGTDNGDNGVLRWNYYDPYIGTCRETFEGGNHFRWWKQAETDAYFFAASEELDLAQFHMIALNGYNLGRDWLGGCWGGKTRRAHARTKADTCSPLSRQRNLFQRHCMGRQPVQHHRRVGRGGCAPECDQRGHQSPIGGAPWPAHAGRQGRRAHCPPAQISKVRYGKGELPRQRLTPAPSPAATPTAQRLPWLPPPLPC